METRPDRFTAFADANVLVPVLWRNLLLSFAASGAYRLRFSREVLDETRRALERVAGLNAGEAAEQVRRIAAGVPGGLVEDYAALAPAFAKGPDPKDAHVMAAAARCRASVIVTQNLADFPAELLAAVGIEAVNIDDFLADAVDLDQERAAAVVRKMRARFKRPEMDAAGLLALMRNRGLPQMAALLEGIADQL